MATGTPPVVLRPSSPRGLGSTAPLVRPAPLGPWSDRPRSASPSSVVDNASDSVDSEFASESDPEPEPAPWVQVGHVLTPGPVLTFADWARRCHIRTSPRRGGVWTAAERTQVQAFFHWWERWVHTLQPVIGAFGPIAPARAARLNSS